jgi:hypothetical protein
VGGALDRTRCLRISPRTDEESPSRRRCEALLLGSAPVVEHSTADALYSPFPVVLLDDFSAVTSAAMRRHTRVRRAARDPTAAWRVALRASYWQRRILRARHGALRDAPSSAPIARALSFGNQLEADLLGLRRQGASLRQQGRSEELRCWGLRHDYPHARIQAQMPTAAASGGSTKKKTKGSATAKGGGAEKDPKLCY